MSDQEKDLKKAHFGEASDSGNKDTSTSKTISLEEFRRRPPRALGNDLGSSSVYQKLKSDSPPEEVSPLEALGDLDGLDDSDESDFGFNPGSGGFTPTRPKVEVVKLDPTKIYNLAPAAAVVTLTRPKVEVVRLDPTRIYLPTEVEDELPTEVEDELPTEVEDELPTEVEDELPTEVEEVLPTEVEGDQPNAGIDTGADGEDDNFGGMNEAQEDEVPFAEAVTPSLVEDDSDVEEKLLESGEPELQRVEFRAPKVGPVLLNREKIYAGQEPKSDPIVETVPEVEPDPAPLESVGDDLEESSAASQSPKIEQMEVMELENKESTSLSRSGDTGKEISKWAFWKRPSKRDQQLTRISEGYLEMVDLVRAVRGQLESQNKNNIILRDSLAHLPEAMKGLDSFSKSQATVGKALQEIHGQMKMTGAKDEKLTESMNGFNDTLKEMDGTSKATIQTFDRVQERMRDSDIRMENLFQNVQNAEEKVSDTMVRLQRNMAIMQSIFLICLMIVIGVLIFTLVSGKSNKDEPAPVQKIVVEAPAAVAPVKIEPTPDERD